MRPIVVRSLVVAAITLAAACGAGASEANNPQDIAAVNTLRTAFMTAFNSGDAAGVGQAYTADAIEAGNHTPSLSGRDAIVASHKQMFEQMTAKIVLTPEETKTMGSSGYDRGTFKFTMTPKAGGAAINDEGRYLVLLEKGTDGSWHVARDIDNSTLPLPAPPAPMPEKKKGK
jgi:uncharacterized protein (TIGR02246 family)